MSILLPRATPDEVVMITLTEVDSCASWPATAQTVRVPSSSVMLAAFPMNLTLGTSDISVIKVSRVVYVTISTLQILCNSHN